MAYCSVCDQWKLNVGRAMNHQVASGTLDICCLTCDQAKSYGSAPFANVLADPKINTTKVELQKIAKSNLSVTIQRFPIVVADRAGRITSGGYGVFSFDHGDDGS
ncbi:uncharacterized protein MELLADRAFT_107813 [Melampsora larici-populina 98AG31]|uniref:Uncharacterized protein n=1 Tax=Melampsora larici-populina (strain 98AG31 / pathotype 3-4-7) TaxID=747676 RepID=F4RR09_MELLP|nr:uncharacterized protein MELLADRAFT_107813 [Melampsora larici-populina 98AG31]EGG05228.1 hypothetical protein MELLADRAFT_107813 [Melampsora larici-populina 98AG31]